jgi:hypothetical protein
MLSTTDCPSCRKARLLALGVLASTIGDAGDLCAVTISHWRDRCGSAGLSAHAWPLACAGLLASGAVRLVYHPFDGAPARVVLGGVS